MVTFLIHANPKSPWIADVDGYLPLHWAVNQDEPNVDVVAALLNANPAAAARASTDPSQGRNAASSRPSAGARRS
ncbi:MAG: hypothetical protein ACO27O_05655, partial [Hylemonella sp.]